MQQIWIFWNFQFGNKKGTGRDCLLCHALWKLKHKGGFRGEEEEWGLVSNPASSTNSLVGSLPLPCGGTTAVFEIKMVFLTLIVLLWA